MITDSVTKPKQNLYDFKLRVISYLGYELLMLAMAVVSVELTVLFKSVSTCCVHSLQQMSNLAHR